jgi:hypothetical protein
LLELLDRFAEAWNRHDLDALMSMMTDDSVFESSLVLRRMDSGATEGGGPRRVRRITNDSGRLVAEMEVADAQVGMIAAESIRQPRHPDQRGAALARRHACPAGAAATNALSAEVLVTDLGNGGGDASGFYSSAKRSTWRRERLSP